MHPTTLQSTATIRFQDCDPFGHLNNARYIDYFLNARQDQLAAYYDFHIMAFGQQPAESWVVSKSQIAYLLPAALMETVILQTRLIRITEGQLLVEGLMLDGAARRLKAVCWMEFTYISLARGRPASHPDDMAAFLESVRYDYPDTAYNFDERVGALKAQFRRLPKAGDPILAASF